VSDWLRALVEGPHAGYRAGLPLGYAYLLRDADEFLAQIDGESQ
jgi:hypothetical protein